MHNFIRLHTSRFTLLTLILALSQTALAQVPVVEAGVARGQPVVAQNNPTVSQPQNAAQNTGIMLQMYEQMEQLKRELSDLRGLVEQQSYQIRQMQNEQRDRYLDLDRRVSELTTAGITEGAPGLQPGAVPGQTVPGVLPGQGAVQPVIQPGQTDNANLATGTGNPGATVTPVPVNTPPVNIPPAGNGGLSVQPLPGNTPAVDASLPAVTALPQNEQEVYRTALNLLLEEGRFEESITGFDNYIQSFPSGRYLANAYYWQGEAMILAERYAQAERVFRKVIDEYPTDAKAADAMLKLGVVYNQTGNSGRAREVWESIRVRYPESLAAIRAADDYLSRL